MLVIDDQVHPPGAEGGHHGSERGRIYFKGLSAVGEFHLAQGQDADPLRQGGRLQLVYHLSGHQFPCSFGVAAGTLASCASFWASPACSCNCWALL